MPKKTTKTFGDVMPKIDFYPGLPKVELKTILDSVIEVTDALIVKDFTTQFGTHDFVLLLFTDLADGLQYTTISSGMVIVKKLHYALDNRLLPLLGSVSYNGAYYDIN